MIAVDSFPWHLIEVAIQDSQAAESENQRVFRQFFQDLQRGSAATVEPPISASTYMVTDAGRATYEDFVRDLGTCTVTGFSRVFNDKTWSGFVADLSCRNGKTFKATVEMGDQKVHTLYWGDRPTVFVPSPPPSSSSRPQ